MSEDASATYRGFRKQALYILHRLLTDVTASERIYRPEGSEDLAVFDSSMRLIEAIQVKDYSSDLVLSALKPKSEAGFFARLNRRMKEHQNCTTKLAIFGSLGPELLGAISNADQNDAKHRAEVVRKLCESNSKISSGAAAEMLDGLRGNVIHPVEADLVSGVVQSLQETNVGGELTRAVELLMYWVFDASEHRRDLTRKGLLVQLERIGSYLAALRDSSAEWDVSVSAIKALELTVEEQAQFTDEYRRGVQARWEHIVAGADCPRPERITEIHEQFQGNSAVILRGASGQGKSTLGWRYVHDFCAEGLRFHVKLVEGREHAIRIANALGGHVRRLNLKAVAYLDVSPSDTGWSELVRDLVAAGLQVLIAVREEDFRRANIAVGNFDFSEVILDRVTKEEAGPIFSALNNDCKVNDLDFEEVWAHFGAEEGGPLLEFTHLISEGESLGSRIASQIRWIQDAAISRVNDFSEVHLELLALASVANETGARVSLARLCETVGVNPLAGPLRMLENEYLLRLQEDGYRSTVGGLHALRSQAVVNALFGDMPELWQSYATKVLPLVVDEDVETFLLAVFSRRPESGETIFQHIRTLVPRSWTHAAQIVTALIWEGVSRYERRNREAILAAITKYGGAWWLVCDTFVGTTGDGHREVLEAMNDALKADVQSIPLTPKAEVFDLFAVWIADAPAPDQPSGSREWTSAGDVAYWLGHTGAGGPLRVAIEALLPSPLPAELNIEELSRFVSGRSRVGDVLFADWHGSEEQAIRQKFLVETDSVHVADNGHEVKVYYSVPLADSVTAGLPDAHDWHEQTMRRVRLLRLLFPNRESFGAQGLGLEMLAELIGHDPTFKSIPAKSLPMERSVQLNAIFGNLVAYRHSRPRTWKEYGDAALAFREAASACFRKLHRGWAKLLSEDQPKKNTITRLPGAEIDLLNKLSKLPMFPRSAVDEWGFLSEEKQGKRSVIETMQQRSLRRFDVWRKSFSDFESGVGMVTSKIVELTALCVAEHKGHVANDEDDKAGHLFLVNLGSAWDALRSMQREFRTRFGRFYPSGRLADLDAHEQSNFRHLWAVAVAMRYERRCILSSVGQMMAAEIARRRSYFLESVKVEVNIALGEYGITSVREKPWVLNGVPHLCIVIDYHAPDAVETIAPRVVEAVWRAAQSGGWRPLEWKPLEIEWPKIVLVNLVRGKALLPACATLSTSVFLATPEAIEVKPHHYCGIPMSPEEFEAGGFQLWGSPLLRAVVSLHGNVLAFVMTNIRFHQLVNLIFEYELDQSNTDRILGRFSHELTIVLTVAQRSYAQAMQILDTFACSDRARWQEDLRRLCQFLLFDVEEESSVSLEVETFRVWSDGFQSANEELRKLIVEVVDFAANGET